MKKADAFNKAGSHIVMLNYYHRDGSPVIVEAAGGIYRKAVFRKTTWSYLNDYKPIRYDNIEDDTNVAGTITNPIVIDSFPFFNSVNTRNMFSLEIDTYSIKPDVNETGPEVIYEFTIDTPGTIDISVTDIQSEDIDNDIHLLSGLNIDGDKMATQALARDDHNIIMHIDTGTYYIVVDSFSSSGNDRPGEFTMSASFEADLITVDEDNETPDLSVDETVAPDNETEDKTNLPDENNLNDSQQTTDTEETPDDDNPIKNDSAISVDDEMSKENVGCSILII